MSDPSSVRRGPDFFNYTDGALTGSISRAIQQNDKETLLQLLKKRKKTPLPIPADNRGWTVLHVAAALSDKDCLNLLFEYKDNILVDVNAKTFYGETALYIACWNGCEENVGILLRNGCDPYLKTLQGDTPLTKAIDTGNLKIVEVLLNYPKNIDQPDLQGLTPLHLSALHGRLEISNLLLEKGADIRAKDRRHYLPFHLACQNNRLEVARLLLKSDSSALNYQSKAGISPLMLAVDKGDMNFIRFLLENGANVNACDEKGRMALHFAAYRGDIELLQMILRSTDVSNIEQSLSTIPNVLKANSLYSLTCCALSSRNVECLEILISSKLPRSILETPQVEWSGPEREVYSPLAYLFKMIRKPNDELLDTCLQLLLKHKITTLDEFFKTFQVKWLHRSLKFDHPFSNIFGLQAGPVPRSYPRQQHYLNLLSVKDVNIDYCLQCYHDNSLPFANFTSYKRYYAPLERALNLSQQEPGDLMYNRKLEIVKLLMSTSAILEPDIVCAQFNPMFSLSTILRDWMLQHLEKHREVFQYLISLKPVYFTQFQLRRRPNQADLPRYPYATIQEEFSQSTLKQLCRTVIRQHLREHTLEDNLRNFRRKIMELPLPIVLKSYLLFKD